MHEERKVNHSIRKMLYFISPDCISSIPEISSYVYNHTFSRRKEKPIEDSTKTKSILETSTDGVVLCSTNSYIIELNNSAKVMWDMSDTDVVGTSLIQWFKEKEELGLLLKEVVKTGKKVSNKEFSGVTRSGDSFPVKLSLGVGRWGNTVVITIFVRDCSVKFKQNALIQQEKKNSENLLLNILPAPVALRLKKGETQPISETIEDATCFFSDMVGFTKMSSTMSASELVELLNDIVSKFDELCNYHELEKIKTIGDAYCKYDTTCILIHR